MSLFLFIKKITLRFTLTLTDDLDLGTKKVVLPQRIHKLWPMLKFFADRQIETETDKQTVQKQYAHDRHIKRLI